MALKFDMSRGDYRDMYGQMFPQSSPGERMYQAGENIGTALAEGGRYVQQHIGKYGKEYQKYLEKYKPEHVIGKDGQVTFKGPESFESFRRKGKAEDKRERIYNRIVKSDQIDAVKEHMNKMESKIWAKENRDPSPGEIKAWVESNIDHHPEFLKSLRPGFRQQFREDVSAPFKGLLGAANKTLFGSEPAGTSYDFAQAYKKEADGYNTSIDYYKQVNNVGEDDFTVKKLRADQKKAQEQYEHFNQRFEEERGLFHKGPGKGKVGSAIEGLLGNAGNWYDERVAAEQARLAKNRQSFEGLLGNITSPFFGRKDAKKTKSNLDHYHVQLENAKSALENVDPNSQLGKRYQAEVDRYQQLFDNAQTKLESQKGFFSTPGGARGHLGDWFSNLFKGKATQPIVSGGGYDPNAVSLYGGKPKPGYIPPGSEVSSTKNNTVANASNLPYNMTEQYYNSIIGNPNLLVNFDPYTPEQENFINMIDAGGSDTTNQAVSGIDENYNYFINP